MKTKKDIVHYQNTSENLTEIDIKLIETYLNTTVGYLSIGELELAMQATMKALEINSNYRPACVLLETIKQEYLICGLTYLKENRFNDAIRVFQRAIAIDPNLIEVYCELGQIYLRQLDKEENNPEEPDTIIYISKRITPLVMAAKLVFDALQINPKHQQVQNLSVDIKKRIEKAAQYDYFASIGVSHDLGKQERSKLKQDHISCLWKNGIGEIIEALFLVDVRWGLENIRPVLPTLVPTIVWTVFVFFMDIKQESGYPFRKHKFERIFQMTPLSYLDNMLSDF